MALWYVMMIIGMMIGTELLRAYWGNEISRPAWLRWLPFVQACLLLGFVYFLVQRVIFVLKTY